MANQHNAVKPNFPIPAAIKKRFGSDAEYYEVRVRYLGDSEFTVTRNPGDCNDTWFVNQVPHYGEEIVNCGHFPVWEVDTIDYKGHGSRSTYLVNEKGDVLGSAEW